MPLRDMDREQMWLLPPTLDELLPLDHPARFVAEFVDALDRAAWAKMGVGIEGDPLGAPAYHPRALLSVWLYGFMTNVRSCRKLEAACRDQIPYLWLTGWQHPDHNTLWRFYQGHRQGMRELFKRTVRTAVSLELVDLAMQAVDGTKMAANAAARWTYTGEQLHQLLARVEKSIADLEAQNEGGEDGDPVHLPEKLSDRKTLRQRVRQAMEELPSRELPSRSQHKQPRRINLTDRDARSMKTAQGFVLSYNAQAMVSPLATGEGVTGMMITAVDVVDEVNDLARLTPMVEQAEEVTWVRVPTTLADAGYFGGRHLEECARRGQQVVMPDPKQRSIKEDPYHKDQFTYDEDNDCYYCPRGQTLPFLRTSRKRGEWVRIYRASRLVCKECPALGVCTKNRRKGRALELGPYDAVSRRHRAWMETEEAKRVYKLRKQLVEPVFGIIKEQQGARRFLLRGLANVSAEWTALATAFNLRTLWKVWNSRSRASAELPYGLEPCPAF